MEASERSGWHDSSILHARVLLRVLSPQHADITYETVIPVFTNMSIDDMTNCRQDVAA